MLCPLADRALPRVLSLAAAEVARLKKGTAAETGILILKLDKKLYLFYNLIFSQSFSCLLKRLVKTIG